MCPPTPGPFLLVSEQFPQVPPNLQNNGHSVWGTALCLLCQSVKIGSVCSFLWSVWVLHLSENSRRFLSAGEPPVDSGRALLEIKQPATSGGKMKVWWRSRLEDLTPEVFRVKLKKNKRNRSCKEARVTAVMTAAPCVCSCVFLGFCEWTDVCSSHERAVGLMRSEASLLS